MLSRVGTQGFEGARRSWYPGLWGCSARSKALGMLSGVGTRGFGDARHSLGLWGCSVRLVPRALAMVGLVPRALGVLGEVGTQGFGGAQRSWYPGLWGCSARSGALGMLGRVGTQGVGDARRDWYSGLWRCSAGLVLGALGMLGRIGTQGSGDAPGGRYPGCAGGCPSRRASPLRHRRLRGPQGGKAAFRCPPGLRWEVWPLARFSVSQPRPLMLLPAPMIMRKVELAPLLRCDGCLDNAPIMAAIAAAR